jgi:Phosphoglycerol transferase and related proteins, alkaline phosphatase superfamily
MAFHQNYCWRCVAPLPEHVGPDCPRCGYPLAADKEEQYLRTALYHFQREMFYRGDGLKVAKLQRLYAERLEQLEQLHAADAVQSGMRETAPVAVAAPQPLVAPKPQTNSSVTWTGTAAQEEPRPTEAARSFSWDQAINVVAALGAFLVLIGSLSFIATIHDLSQAFLVLLVVHVFFGAIGLLTFRVPRLRLVSVIYTAVFALQVPLVGYTGLRLLNNTALHPSLAILLVFAAFYASLIYGALAFYQRFKPFGYLAAVSLLIAVLALPSALLLSAYWSGCLFLLCLLPLLLCIQPRDRREQVWWEPLREPGAVLQWMLLAVSVLYLLWLLLLAVVFRGLFVGVISIYDQFGVRLALTVMLGQLCVWVVLYARRSLSYGWLNILPYLFVSLACALVYVYALPVTAYIVVLTCCIVAAYLLRWHATALLQRVPGLCRQMVVLALLLTAVLPLLGDLTLPWHLAALAYNPLVHSRGWYELWPLSVAVCALLVSGLLLLRESWWGSIGREDVTERPAYRWLALLAGAVLSYGYAMVLVWNSIAPIWGFCALALVCALLTVLLYWTTGIYWLRQCATWALVIAVLSIGYAGRLPSETIIALFALYAICSYLLAVYLRLTTGLIVAIGFALAAIPVLLSHTLLFFIFALVLPALAIGYMLWQQQRGQEISLYQRWLWPLMVTGALYGATLLAFLLLHSTGKFFVQVPVVAWEMVLLAVLWFALSWVARSDMLTWLAFVFALPILYCSQLLFWPLVLLAALPLISGWGLSRWWRLRWGLPFLTLSCCTMLLLGLQPLTFLWLGIPFGNTLESSLALMLYALALYGLVLYDRLRIGVLALPGCVLAVLFMSWGIALLPLSYEVRVLLASLLFVLAFASSYLWRIQLERVYAIAPATLLIWLALLGQCLISLHTLLNAGGLVFMSPDRVIDIHLRAAMLAVLGGLLLWYAYTPDMVKVPQSQPDGHMTRSLRQWYCLYGGIFVLSWIPTVEYAAWQILDASVLYVCPALCLLSLSWLISHNERWAHKHLWSQLCALAGAFLLLGPNFGASFGQQDVLATLILGGEALALVVLSFALRQRMLLLGGMVIIIVTAIHILFLPSLGIPSFLALSLVGILLLGMATLLLLLRPRLTAVWGTMD